jgi:hypothetical protein
VATSTANTHSGDQDSSPRKAELHATILENYSIICTGTPTYWPTDENEIPDLLDFCITKGISPTYVNTTASFDLSSDHTPIIATISTTVLPRKPNPILHTSKTNWELFRQFMEDNTTLTTKLKDPADIENDYKHFTALLQEAAKTATPPFYPPPPRLTTTSL